MRKIMFGRGTEIDSSHSDLWRQMDFAAEFRKMEEEKKQ